MKRLAIAALIAGAVLTTSVSVAGAATYSLYGVNTSNLFSINPLTAQSTLIGNVGVDGIGGLTFVPPPAVPIPAVLPLLISALGFFGFMGWRRKKAVAL